MTTTRAGLTFSGDTTILSIHPMRRRHATLRFAFASSLVAAVIIGCDSAVGPIARSGLTIRGDPGLVDTVSAPPARVIVQVQQRDLLIRERVQVTFRYGQVVPAGSPEWLPYFYLLPVPNPTTGAVIDTTDEGGQAEAALVHGSAAGARFLLVEARALTPDGTLISVDSALVRTTAGQPAKILLAPRDTTLFQGSSATFAATVADRYGNPRTELAQLEAGTSGVSVSGDLVRADSGPSRQVVRARAGALTDSAWLSIVPRGAFAAGAAARYVGESGDLVVINLDGSGLQPALVTSQAGDYGVQPAAMNVRWDQTGTRLVYQRTSSTDRLFIGDLAAVARPLLYPSPFSAEFHPDFSPDGVWVYFAARVPGLATSSLWRVHPDGTGLGQAPFSPDGSESRPALSPDGQWLAYSSDGFVHVRSLVTGARTALNARGTAPRWSPSSDAIAYVNAADDAGYSGPLRVVRPDGTEDRQLVIEEAYAPGVDWTPDGKYLVAKTANYGLLELINVATGTRIPLPYSGLLQTPAWRPPSPH
ncbi:MAG TPA: hypothetical protein VM716_15315 [Gemmatimonadales bacterium]|nr:hypothetical protein [Gemmatimonadales bacterium]